MISINLEEDEFLTVYESLLKTLKDDYDYDPVVQKFRQILLSVMSKDSFQSQLHSSRSILNEEKFKSWESQEAKKIKDLDDMNKNSTAQLTNLTGKVKKRKSRG